jgi:hypothetical protein
MASLRILKILVPLACLLVGCASAKTDPPSDVGPTSAVLHGRVDPGGTPTEYWFEYGTTAAYGTKTQAVNAGSQAGAQAVNAQIDGLVPGRTLYHYKLCVNHLTGYRWYACGADYTFQTAMEVASQVDTQIDSGMNAAWAAYGNDNSKLDDWTGGDGGASIPLPDGRIAWIFADAFIGMVEPHVPPTPPSRPTNSPILNSSIVTGHGDNLERTVVGRTEDGKPTSLIPRPPGFSMYTGDGLIENGELKVLTYRTVGLSLVGTEVSTFSLPDLEYLRTEQASPATPTETGIFWGFNMLEEADYTYIYGGRGGGGETFVARVPQGNILGSWEYWAGDTAGWSPNEADVVSIAPLASGSVVRHGDGFVMAGKEAAGASTIYSDDIFMYSAPNPWGPWENRQHIYKTPEASQAEGVITYSVVLHPENVDAQGMLLTYSVNTWAPTTRSNFEDVGIYRNRHLRVRF